jgi:lysophospholipase L1-like esterase
VRGAGTWVLVVGDSWATGRKLDAGIRAALLERSGGPVEVISRGWAGAKSAEVARRARPLLPGLAARRPARRVLVLVAGINDAFCHTGAGQLGRNARRLADAAVGLGLEVVVLRVPYFNARDRSFDRTWAWRLVRRWWRDGGLDDARLIDRYNRALELWLGGLDGARLLDSSPLLPPRVRPAAFRGDRLHLWPDGYARLGRWIGEQL